MKKLYFIGLAIIMLSAGTFMAYGAYLNDNGERQILQHMKYQTIRVNAEKAKIRSFRPIFILNKVKLNLDDKAPVFSLLSETSTLRRFPISEHFELNFTNSSTEKIFLVHVKQIKPELNLEAPQRKVFFEVDNPEGILEQSGVGILTGTTTYKALMVPLSAMNDTRQFIFVLTAQNTPQKRKVSVGTDDGKYIEVLSGLKEGEIVITETARDVNYSRL